MNISDIQIKTYDFIPKDEMGLVTPGQTAYVTRSDGKVGEYQIKEPQIVKVKGLAWPAEYEGAEVPGKE